MEFLFLLMVYGLLALIPAHVASNKGRSFGEWWCLGFCTTPIISFIACIIIHDEKRQEEKEAFEREQDRELQLRQQWDQFRQEQKNRKCPHCAEIVKKDAKICRFCGRDLPTLQHHDNDIFEYGDSEKDQNEQSATAEQKNVHPNEYLAPEIPITLTTPKTDLAPSDCDRNNIKGEWYYTNSGQVYGPFQSEALKGVINRLAANANFL